MDLLFPPSGFKSYYTNRVDVLAALRRPASAKQSFVVDINVFLQMLQRKKKTLKTTEVKSKRFKSFMNYKYGLYLLFSCVVKCCIKHLMATVVIQLNSLDDKRVYSDILGYWF